MPKNQYKVSVECITFNQAAYIEEAMNGFCQQQTKFPFVCVIIDDASTDGEQEVIKSYLEDNLDLGNKDVVRNEETNDYKMTFAQHRSNSNCFFAVFLLKYNHYQKKKSKRAYFLEWTQNAKYIAICEGDDYWTFPTKLQMQVEEMDSNNRIGLCYTNARVYIQSKNKYEKPFSHPYLGTRDLLSHNPIMTLTTMFRRDMYFNYLEEVTPEQHDWKLGDYPLWIWLAIHSDIKYIDIVTSVYRMLDNSASHSPNIEKNVSFIKSINDVRLYYINRYFPDDQQLKDQVDNDLFFRLANAYDQNNDRVNYIKYLKMMKSTTPSSRFRWLLYSNDFLYFLYKFIKRFSK